MIHSVARRVFSERTWSLVQFDIMRFRTRRRRSGDGDLVPSHDRLHLGAGPRRVQGWLNVDLANSECDVDLAGGRLPWRNGVFEAVVSQHVIEHLELETELLPLLRELRRVLKPGGEIWLSCPDIEKICRSYLEHRMVDLLEDRVKRWPDFSLRGAPSTHMINHLFHQEGQHRNLFDFDLLEWALDQAGFTRAERMQEADLLRRFPGFPPRNDDKLSIYARALAG